ncbi:hypothetical protein pb186bvf_002672 [Paramecium bursaria]
MLDPLNFTLRKCYDEKLHFYFTPYRKRSRMQTQIDNEMRVVELPKIQEIQEPQFNDRLEYSPRNIFHLSVPQPVRSERIQTLPMIDLEPRRRQEHSFPSMESGDMTRKNGRMHTDKLKQSNIKYKKVTHGPLQIDPESPQVQMLFKQIASNSPSKTDYHVEITKTQLQSYLQKIMETQGYVNRILNHLNFPTSISFNSYKLFLAQLNDLSYQEIIKLSFSGFDQNNKGYINQKDLFDVMMASKPIVDDMEQILNYLKESPKLFRKQTMQKSQQISPKKRKRIMITQLVESDDQTPKRMRSQANKEKEALAVSLDKFKLIFLDDYPQSIRQLIYAISCFEIPYI